MYCFFLIFFIFVSLSLVFLILLQPVKGFSNTLNVNNKSNTKFFSTISSNGFITNMISIFAFLFLLTSIILCNINIRKIEPDFFSENSKKNTIHNEIILDKKLPSSDIPH